MNRAPAISSVLELPFHRQAPLVALGFEAGRQALNVEHTGYGWCQPRRLWLQSGDGDGASGQPRLLVAPLVLALHSADDGPTLDGDVVLEFALPGAAPVMAPLSLFLSKWLPRLLAEAGGPADAAADAPANGAIVLAMCNPHRVVLPLPAAAGGRTLWYGLGDVDSWLDELDEEDGEGDGDEDGEGGEDGGVGGRLRLVASQWHAAIDDRVNRP